ncbi:hypothetical protein BWI17_20060 [Betaproteobacteria bacterium GR16-43]|nr:hypothetical protein BWI17_20060 [Betaproteobacteria bacterium GR16-43]
MARTSIPSRFRFSASLLALSVALAATAQTLGDLEVRSAPGEPLDATIALGTAAGAAVGTDCIFLSRGAPEDGPFITRANVAVFEVGGERFVRLKSEQPVNDRKARMRIVVRCPGQPHVAYREYRDLFEARAQVSAPVPPAVSAGPGVAPAAAPSSGAGALPVRAGDTMASLAALLLPRQPAAQQAYVQALREANPSLAALGAKDPIPQDAIVALPDLRSVPRGPVASSPRVAAQADMKPGAESPAPAKIAKAPEPARARAPDKASPPAKAPPPTKAARAGRPADSESPPSTSGSPKTAAKSVAAPARVASGDERPVLRLSGAQMDLAPSRSIDDAGRAKLRERLLVLDSDDQVAALLSLRDSLKRLEGRVAELQLKISGMPATMPRADPAPVKVEAPAPVKAEAPAKPEPPKPEPPKAEAPKPEPAKIEAPKVESARIEPPVVVVAEAAAPKSEPVAPKSEAVAPKAEPTVEPVQKTESTPKAVARPTPRAAVEPSWGVVEWLWVVAIGGMLLALWLAWSLWRRRAYAEEELPEIPEPDSGTVLGPNTEPPDDKHIDIGEPVHAGALEGRRREIDSDATLATEVHGTDPAELRRRYIEERFPEIAHGTIDLADAGSVVKSARLFYEEGAVPRAIELLQLATEEHPGEARTWLALFEIYRLERMTTPFADLAQRFRDRHGHTENWRKVQFFGREIDPGNVLYRDMTVGIETIRFEAGKAPAAETYDPITENWLNAPADFENELLAVELRRSLMDEAKLSDEDLAPNPMPALRRVDMFTVA